jgi:hypothetical protein
MNPILPYLILLILVLFSTTVMFGLRFQDERHKRLFEIKKFNPYKNKGYFMSNAEKKLFSILNNLECLQKYYVFPQVSATAVIDTKDEAYDLLGKFDWVNKYRLDFVICDKETISPHLVIELNDSSHFFPNRSARDEFLDIALKGASVKYTFFAIRDLTNIAVVEERVNKLLS